jgi:hypothetical protein
MQDGDRFSGIVRIFALPYRYSAKYTLLNSFWLLSGLHPGMVVGCGFSTDGASDRSRTGDLQSHNLAL